MITLKQSKILNIIKNYVEQNGIPPTLKQISSISGIKSLSSIHRMINELVQNGYLSRDNKYGNLNIKSKDVRFFHIPILGNIAAGYPIEAIEDTQPKTIEINTPNNTDYYALRVQGDSMIDEGIFDGDIVVIKKQSTAYNGQTVVAIIDDNSATLKKIYKEKDRFRLQPSNQSLLPLFRKEVEIRGVVWKIIRNFDNETFDQKIKIYKTIDLFAGVGGLRLGFEKFGFRTVFANDFDKACKVTYDLNFKNSKMILEDISKIAVNDVPDFDFLIAGFPCQAFSIAGYRQGFADPRGRGNLFFDIVRIIKAKKPEGFLLENVKNLQSHDNGKTFEVISNTLVDLGYHIKVKVLNSMDYGNIPQNRERIYIVGFKDPIKAEAFEFPEKITLKKEITDLLDSTVPEKYYYNNKPLYNRIKDDIKDEGKVYQWRRQYVRENKKGVSPTLTANMGTGGHNVPIIKDQFGIRKLTPRECFRLQGFPDTYMLPDNLGDSALYKQAGNSVTVPVIERIADKIYQVMCSY